MGYVYFPTTSIVSLLYVMEDGCPAEIAVTEELCRWRQLSRDQLPCNELMMTRVLIADMLGVRREGVVEAVMTKRRNAGPRPS